MIDKYRHENMTKSCSTIVDSTDTKTVSVCQQPDLTVDNSYVVYEKYDR